MMGLNGGNLGDCFSDSPGSGFEGWYPNRFWFGTDGKCMLDFVVTGFWTVHNGF